MACAVLVRYLKQGEGPLEHFRLPSALLADSLLAICLLEQQLARLPTCAHLLLSCCSLPNWQVTNH